MARIKALSTKELSVKVDNMGDEKGIEFSLTNEESELVTVSIGIVLGDDDSGDVNPDDSNVKSALIDW